MTTVFAQLIATARSRPLVTFCLVLTVILGGSNYFLWKQRAIIAQQNDEVRRKGEGILNALVARQHVTADLTKLKDALEVIDRNLVVESDMEENLGYFYKLEKLTGVRLSQLNQLSAPPPPEGGPFKTIPVSLRATGTYVQLMNFLHQLETGPRILTVRAFNFTRGDPKNNLLALDLTVALLARP
jgi:Tfp pilus assembly protein PilO